MSNDKILEWTDDLLQGDYSLETHTKEFLRKANDFIYAVRQGTAEEEIDNFLEFLTEYARKHFVAQEEVMQRIHYPSYEAHAAEHKKFVRNVASLFKKRLLLRRDTKDIPDDEYDSRGMDGVIIDLNDFVHDWYSTHMIDSDKRFCIYFTKEYKS